MKPTTEQATANLWRTRDLTDALRAGAKRRCDHCEHRTDTVLGMVDEDGIIIERANGCRMHAQAIEKRWLAKGAERIVGVVLPGDERERAEIAALHAMVRR